MIKWQRDIQQKLNQISNRKSIKRNHLEFILSTFFSNMKKQIQKPSMPTVMIHRFGEFTPSRYKLRRRIEYLEEKMEGVDKNSDEYRKYEKDKKHKVKILNRLNKEKTKRDGKK